ncbi:MAG: FkbM family methyltransferase [Nitrososphaerota archaeon]
MNKRSIQERVLKLADVMGLPLRTRWGVKWVPIPDSNSWSILLEKPHPEEDIINFVRSYLREGDVFVDIGSHHGLYTLLAAKQVGKAGKVISFEPSPRERVKLMRNIRANRCQNLVTVEPFALSDTIGEVQLLLAPTFHSGLNSLRPINEPIQVESVISVKSTTLDEYVKQKGIHRIKLIKVDAEGAELSILRGSLYVLQHLRPIWVLEASSRRTMPWGYTPHDLVSFMSDMGYTCYRVSGKKLVPLAEAALDIVEDYIIAAPQTNEQNLPLWID